MNEPFGAENHTSTTEHRCGFVSIAGRPNAGKSTLLNALVGEKVAITAPQPQTTRTSIQGILTRPGKQIVFVDTPGIHRSDSSFNRRMMDAVRDAVDGRDLALFVVDATAGFTVQDEHAVSILKDSRAILVVNKIDRLADKAELLPLIERYSQLHAFLEVVPVSAMKHEGLDRLEQVITDLLPEAPALFPENQFTTQPMKFMAAEFIREQILKAAKQEVPHAVAVLIDEWQETPSLVRISATLHVERPGQKSILIGRGGAMLKRIGTKARLEIEELLGAKVFLALFVRVQPNWREDPVFLQTIDWRTMLGSS